VGNSELSLLFAKHEPLNSSLGVRGFVGLLFFLR
jgi:hypothetical protein